MKTYNLYFNDTEYLFKNLEDAQLAQSVLSKGIELHSVKHQGIFREYKGDAPHTSVTVTETNGGLVFENEEDAKSAIELKNTEKAQNFKHKVIVEDLNIFNDFIINYSEAKKLRNFCKKHELKEFFICKDHGAYIGATKHYDDSEAFEKSIHYVACSDPEKNGSYQVYIDYNFGEDDFSHNLPVAWLDSVCSRKDSLVIQIVGNTIGLTL